MTLIWKVYVEYILDYIYISFLQNIIRSKIRNIPLYTLTKRSDRLKSLQIRSVEIVTFVKKESEE